MNENTFDLTALTVEELVTLEATIKELKAVKRVENKLAVAEAKELRTVEMKDAIGEGDKITFLYGRENGTFEGTVVRASEKSVTVKSAVFAENGKKDTNYVRYDRVVAILEKGTVEGEVVETATEEVAV